MKRMLSILAIGLSAVVAHAAQAGEVKVGAMDIKGLHQTDGQGLYD